MTWADLSPAIGLSLLCAVVAVGLCLLPAAMLAMVLARRQFPGKALVELAITLPVVVPPVVTGYALLKLLGRSGLLGPMLEEIGLSIAFTWFGAAIAQAVVAMPLLVLTLRGAFASVDRELEQAAEISGAGRWRIFWSITLPLSWQAVTAGCVLAFARALGEFGATIIVAGNIEGRTRTVPLAIFTALQSPGAEMETLVLVLVAVGLAATALAAYRLLMHREPLR